MARFRAVTPSFPRPCPGLVDGPARRKLAEAEAAWRTRLPQEQSGLWAWLTAEDMTGLLALLAFCVARTAEGGSDDWTAVEGGDGVAATVAAAAGLDMRRCWSLTKESYFERVSKATILDAVEAGAGPATANRIRSAKKAIMAADAETLLAGTGWLPSLLRLPTGVDAAGSGETPLALAAE